MSNMTEIGPLQPVADGTMAANVRHPGSETQAAIDERVVPATAAALASPDATNIVTNAVEIAAEPAVNALLDESPRVPRIFENEDYVVVETDANGFATRTVRRSDGATWMKLQEDVRVPGQDTFEDEQFVGGYATADGLRLLGFRRTTGAAVFRHDPTVVFADIVLGQSNAEGRARGFDQDLDFVRRRHAMWSWSNAGLELATTPMSSYQSQIGLSAAAHVVARATLAEYPEADVVTLNAGIGGTGLVAEPNAGNLAVDYAGATPKLWTTVVAPAISAFVAAVRFRYPDPETRIIWRIWWSQGEAESTTDQALYASKLDAVIAATRALIGDTTAPVVVSGIVPDYLSANLSRQPTVLAHIDTPARLVRTAYAPGVANGGGSQNVGDVIHYAREGVERLGRRMFEAWKRALLNTATSVPQPVLDVALTRTATGAVTVAWSPAWCRVTSYTVQHRTDAGAWVTLERPVPLALTETIPATPGTTLAVRVATVNLNGTSAFTTPVQIGL